MPEAILEQMNPITPTDLHCYVAGEKVQSDRVLSVHNPYDRRLAGTVRLATGSDVEKAIKTALVPGELLSRFARSAILEKAGALLKDQQDDFARLISAESGLCLRETRYEVGRALDVLRFSAMEALRDDGQIFSCDISQQGKPRKIFTIREPLTLAVAITPFNHPLNQVAHKAGPAIAAGTPLILKPSEKTPLTAIRFAELLYAAGLPPRMLSVLLGPTDEVSEPLVRDSRVELVSFTGSVAVGKRIAQTAGYKRVVLELGGNDPLIVLDDADLELAVHLAAEGAFRNSGQRCTAVKRILVEAGIAREFTDKFVEHAREYKAGDPADPETRVGTVIDEASAIHLEHLVRNAVAAGAKVLLGGERKGALLQPTVIGQVPRQAELVVHEAFGPLAPILVVRDLEDAIQVANSTRYGLSSGVVTRSLDRALLAVKSLRCGTVNINEIPGYRIESSPFGGIKDSGLGIKEGVVEAIKCFTTVKTFSLPW
jgi:phosphonoacetaldehyde dehydrogenase